MIGKTLSDSLDLSSGVPQGGIYVLDRQTNALTPFTGWGCEDLFFKLNLLPPYALRSQGKIK